MLSTTEAIVLSLQPHSDKAHILHAYTRAYGRINYMVYGRGRKNAPGLYTPLSLIQITASHPASGMPTVKEATQAAAVPAQPMTAHYYKNAVALFVSEVLYHVLRHPMPDEPMFDYIEEAVYTLNRTEHPENFHIVFMTGLADKLGFAMEQPPALPKNRAERQQVLRALCSYFEEHVETWKEPKSLAILTEVFD